MGKRQRRTARQQVAFPQRRPWWRPGRLFGPGMLFALVMAVVVGLRGDLPRPRPKLERPTVGDAQPMALPQSEVGLVPEPGWLVRRAEEVGLTATQRQQARAAAVQWEQDLAAQQPALDQAQADLNEYLAARQERGTIAEQQVRSRAQSVSELSAALAARRHAAWDAMWATLTEAQRTKVKALRQQAPLELR